MKKTLKYAFLIIGAVIFAYPFLWMIAGSLKPELEISRLSLWSQNFTLGSYKAVFTKIPIARAFLNSMLVSITVTASVVIFGSMVGYALARLHFIGKGTTYVIILFTMMIPAQITLIPQYV